MHKNKQIHFIIINSPLLFKKFYVKKCYNDDDDDDDDDEKRKFDFTVSRPGLLEEYGQISHI